jgi:hypothetical protein
VKGIHTREGRQQNGIFQKRSKNRGKKKKKQNGGGKKKQGDKTTREEIQGKRRKR